MWQLIIHKISVVAEMGDRLATILTGLKVEVCCAPFHGGAAGVGPHLTQCRLGTGLPPYQAVSWSIQPFGHNKHGLKSGVAHFLSPKILGRPEPPNDNCYIGSGHCGRKSYTLEVWVDQQKILRYWTKYAFLRIIYSLSIFSTGCIKTPCGDAPSLVMF